MKFATVLFVGLAAADMSYMSHMSKRQVEKMIDIFAKLTDPVDTLRKEINAYQSGPGDDILAQSDKIVGLVKDSVAVASSSTDLPLSKAGELVLPVQQFSELLANTIHDLIAKKQLAVQNNLGGKVYANLQKQAAGAQALSTAIKSKMPATLASTADELSGYITGNITLGVKAFADQAGAGAGAGGAASSPSSGSSTSASGSAGGAGAGMSLSPAGSSTSLSGSGAGAGMSSSGMSGMAGAGAGAGSAAGAGASSPMTTGAPGSGPAVFMGAGASFKPASIFGLVAVAAAVLAF